MASFKRALRSLLKSPGFTFIAVVTLAFGIGANTAMFSLLNALVLRPLPFTHAEELVRLWRTSNDSKRGDFSPADYLELKHTETDAGQFAAFFRRDVALSAPGLPAENGRLMAVSSDFFDVLDVQPMFGRNFQPIEENFGNHRIVLLSHNFWQNHFGGAANIVGRTVRIDGEPHEIIGVLPDWATERRPLKGNGLFRPLGLTDEQRASHTNFMLDLIGRRGPGVSVAQFETFVSAFRHGFAEDFPDANLDTGWRMESLASSGMNPTGRMIVFMLIGLSGSVLLIACSNLANFLLARTMARAREFAVRSALGASRWHLIVPLAWESLVIAITGGIAALFVSNWTTNWISAESARNGDAPLLLPFDWRVLGFALAAALVTALVFGIAPALFAMRVDLNDTLKSGARGATASRGHQRLRNLLIVGQFTLAMIILSSAGFFIRGAKNLVDQNFGWDTGHVAQGAYELPKSRYPGSDGILAFESEAAQRLNALPGVVATSFSYGLPYTGLPGERRYLIEGRDTPPQGREPSAQFNGVSPDYFTVTGTRLLNGRTFVEGDNATSPRVAIISESFARIHFPEQNPVGLRIARAGSETPQWMEIVGVVADVRSAQTNRAPNTSQVYHPFAQEPWHFCRFAVRTAGIPPETIIDPIRQTMASLDRDLPLLDLMSAEQQFQRVASDLYMINYLLGAFALLALGLAALGIYGVIARTVAQRTGEFGIRIALGAQVSHILGIVLKSGVRLALVGAAIGFLGAFGLSRVLASGLPGLQTSSGAVLAGVTALLIAIALLASYLPARRAAKINPIDALRAD